MAHAVKLLLQLLADKVHAWLAVIRHTAWCPVWRHTVHPVNNLEWNIITIGCDFFIRFCIIPYTQCTQCPVSLNIHTPHWILSQSGGISWNNFRHLGYVRKLAYLNYAQSNRQKIEKTDEHKYSYQTKASVPLLRLFVDLLL